MSKDNLTVGHVVIGVFAAAGLVLFSPILLAVWLCDRIGSIVIWRPR